MKEESSTQATILNYIHQSVKSQIKSKLSNTWRTRHALKSHRRCKQRCNFASYLQDARMPMRDSANEGNRGWQARDRAMYQRQRRASAHRCTVRLNAEELEPSAHSLDPSLSRSLCLRQQQDPALPSVPCALIGRGNLALHCR